MDAKLFERLFPFSISFDERFKVYSLGNNLKKIFPELVVGRALDDYFEVQLDPFSLKSKKLDLTFVGELIRSDEIYFLLGGVWPSNKTEVSPEMIDLETFMTICYGRFDWINKKLTFVDAGHTSTLHYKAKDHAIDEISGDNVPLGFLKDEIYRETEVHFDCDDLFLFYSDGVTESRSESGEFFGLDKLKSVVKRLSSSSPQEMGEKILEELKQFTRSGRLQDDLTMIIVKVDQEGPKVLEEKQIAVQATFKELAPIRSFVRAFCQNLKEQTLGENKIMRLELAVDEAVTNIIEHALEGQDDSTILIKIQRFEDHLLLHLDYEGPPFKPDKPVRPKTEKMAEGGLGLYLIERLTEGVEYKEMPKGQQRITLRKIL